MTDRMTDTPSCITVQAYAKINTFLAVTGRRADGYHTLCSHMQGITLADTLTVCRTHEPGVRLQCNHPSLSCGPDNLIVRAAQAFYTAGREHGLTLPEGLDIELDKRIPMAAGLAGGSADAAAVLRALNRLCGEPLTQQQLCTIGARIGADVPFCIYCEESAMTARGIGDDLTPSVGLSPRLYLVVACSGEEVSTPWAYRLVDATPSQWKPAEIEQRYARFLRALELEDMPAVAALSYNCFEAPVLAERPLAAALLQDMERSGAIFARMSGSGPTVVGFFADEQAARAYSATLDERQLKHYVCRPL